MAEKPAGEKTEKATPRKIKKARSEGHIGHSAELGSWLSMLAATFVLPGVCKSLMSNAQTTLVQASAVIDNPDVNRAMGIARDSAFSGAKAVAPLAILVMVTSVISSGSQGGIHVAPKLLMPKFSRLNPLSGVKRMFGPQALWQLTKSLLKIAVLGGVTYLAVRHLVPTLMGAGSLPLAEVLTQTMGAALSVIRYGSAAGVLLAFADVAVVRRRNNKQLKMTKQEIKEEMKQSEGDPQMKGAIRSRALAMARNRMMADIPDADVILVNPTHVAVALKYDPKKGAPRVVAKGADHIATRIREIAAEHRVPMVADIPLARALYGTCEVGHEIPADMFQGVATVLAFVMRLKRRGSIVGIQQLANA
ncbi:EscU/YscU/HrcU family type III secretion system export apparatus switch protein [Jatrophihabitans telluris]|uniref:EscU/YscU/HrcU family type III secretion system export apparatus switch protein n=1 Tax=Jatrophihabitans telluris TaxID=2038343 RepID=A0ABY4QYM7_9ACTN|nr:EscU/YscU/HrcU family type III secretion system export apparatus switch protein [Jatrophihabitans telluris]UQX87969.1 EscU/YscU/HrcU family type III secretion system export apparatus switch protein [Jatrophihabitans telluris]